MRTRSTDMQNIAERTAEEADVNENSLIQSEVELLVEFD